MKIKYSSIIPFKGFKALNLFGIWLFVRKGETLTEKELNHENIHSIQWRETWYMGFALLYVFHLLYLLLVYWNFHKAYRNICFELEAYNNDDYPNYLIYREKYAWKDYL